ncbi:MAG: OmpA family protein [Bacteroidetes bacterium]|nr:OmpA family protein [Bacteroidota bacterium]
MKKLVLLCICLAFASIINAQTEDKKWNIGLHGGITQYAGDLGTDFYKFDQSWYGFGGISVSRYIVNHFDINLLITKGTFGYNRNSEYFNSGFTSALLNFRFNLLSTRNAVNPFIFVGGGIMVFDKDLEISPTKIDFAAPSFGGGINFRFGKTINLSLQETFIYSTSDKRDGVSARENDFYLLHTVGLTFNFGKKKDADKDGVSDRYDKCPDTPFKVAVDKFGCPLDKDNDGVADYLDECPDVAGLSTLKGCPDKDSDGIADKNDRCPDAAGPVSLKGCPDKDGDGVPDIDDQCPDTQAGFKVNASGCPMDNDKDGIVNENDRCPDLAGPESLKGCPDTDGDGVADIDDRCPLIQGTIANKGCPEIAKEDLVKITNIASKIFFETTSDKLKVASLSQLDELVLILKKYESANLLIEGHADSQGADDYNLTLSQKRTDAVKTYLMGKGIMESRLTAIGYGESRPIADNNTALGRSKNRRVELKTSYGEK